MEKDFLVTLPADLIVQSNLSFEIYYQSQKEIIAKVSKNDLEQLNTSGIYFKILDEFNENEQYYLITDLQNKYCKFPSRWGRSIYNFSNSEIISSNDFPVIEISKSKYEFVKLSPHKLKKRNVIYSGQSERSRDLIDDVIAEVNQDSISYIIQSLQDFDTRYALADNRDEVVNWIQNRFLELGFVNVIIDSFYWNNTWQKNVIAIWGGNIDPDNYTIIGGHHDSITNINPLVSAPGADDNATACASVLETARVLKSVNYQPVNSLMFCTFAAEEFGKIGSEKMADSLSAENCKIKGMVNSDMIGFNTRLPGDWIVWINEYSGAEYLTDLGIDLMTQYTSLNYGGSLLNNGGSDSYSFWQAGYDATWYFEDEFNPYYHSESDVLGNMDLEYCTEIIKLNTATFVVLDQKPNLIENYSLFDIGNGSELLLEWSPADMIDLLHYKIHVGTESGVYTSEYTTTDTTFTIFGLEEGVEYFVGVNIENTSGVSGMIVERSCIPLSTPQIPSGLFDEPALNAVQLFWQENEELDLWGYNVFRSDDENGQFVQINQEIVLENEYIDDYNGTDFQYYAVTAVDFDNNESDLSEIIISRAVTLNSGILLIDGTPAGNGSYGNPSEQECDDFYHTVLEDFSFQEIDLEDIDQFFLKDISIYSTILIHFNKNLTPFLGDTQIDELRKYLDFGGNILATATNPSDIFDQYCVHPHNFTYGNFLFDYFKIDLVDYESSGRFFYAAPEPGFNYISVDTTKTLVGLEYHLTNVEAVHPNIDGDLLYSYGSNFTNNSSFGVMNDEPVAVGYFGSDFKTALFSFPFYYMNEPEVKLLVQSILIDHFGEFVPEDQNIISPKPNCMYGNYPNPFNPETTIRFSTTESTKNTEISVYNMKGQKVKQLVRGQLSAGQHSVVWNGTDENNKPVSSGVYFYKMQADDFIRTRKMILLK